jgi:hypothetical protein
MKQLLNYLDYNIRFNCIIYLKTMNVIIKNSLAFQERYLALTPKFALLGITNHVIPYWGK